METPGVLHAYFRIVWGTERERAVAGLPNLDPFRKTAPKGVFSWMEQLDFSSRSVCQTCQCLDQRSGQDDVVAANPPPAFGGSQGP